MPDPQIISYSETLAWDSCPRQYYYQFILGLTPNDLSDAITTGTKGHHLLQAFYESMKIGATQDEALEYVHKKAKKMMESPLFDPATGDLLKAWGMVNKYIREATLPGSVELVENRFLVPLNMFTDDPVLANIQIGFTPDVVFNRKWGFYTVEDSKFIQRAWPKKKLNRFPQAKLYSIFLQKIGYNVTRSSVRFFNTTTGDITEHGDTMTPQEPAILIRDFIKTVREIALYKNEHQGEVFEYTRRTMNYSNCQYCFFEQPCTTEAEGRDASKIFKYMFRKNDYDYSS